MGKLAIICELFARNRVKNDGERQQPQRDETALARHFLEARHSGPTSATSVKLSPGIHFAWMPNRLDSRLRGIDEWSRQGDWWPFGAKPDDADQYLPPELRVSGNDIAPPMIFE